MKSKKTSRFTLFGLSFALLLLIIAPVSAITDGELDGENHPHVVLILMEVDGAPSFRCTGTLISPKFVVTAGHCTNNFPDMDYSGMRIFLESDVDNGNNNYPFKGKNSVEAKRFAAHPLYETAPFYVHDVGMIELKKPVYLDEYGALPEVDSLDGLSTGSGTTFTAVGYGLQAAQLNNPTPQAHTQADRIRMVAYPHLIQSNTPGYTGDFALLLSNNSSTGGTCFGDSGGANFLGDSNVIAAVTSFGSNPNCAGTGGVFRLDRQNVQDFINDFMSDRPPKHGRR
jgi:V8-like Glu-specific endopeptidase